MMARFWSHKSKPKAKQRDAIYGFGPVGHEKSHIYY